jgi:hypothetical protein
VAQNGTLVIADITGYTAFLSGSELEHAQDSLGSLLNLLLRETKAPLKVANLEGDAVFTYAVEGSFLQGQTLVEAIEQTYVVFRRALRQMVLNTSCRCNACKNIPNLDLKFFVHHGEFGLQKLGSRVDLVGTDVTLLHRLAKNTITEKTGLVAYAAYTEAAVEALDASEMSANMIRHSETYEHLGKVDLFVQDMTAVWERERDRARIVVEPEDALATVEYVWEAGRSLVWDYSTKPEHRALLFNSETGEIDGDVDGRIGRDTIYYCAHGDSTFEQTIVDWLPTDQYTFVGPGPLGTSLLSTIKFESIDDGRRTRTLAYIGRLQGRFLARLVVAPIVRYFFAGVVRNGCRALDARMQRDLADGLVIDSQALAPTPDISPEEVTNAAAISLNR